MIKKAFQFVFISIFVFGCSSSDDSSNSQEEIEEVELNSENLITSFRLTINGSLETGIINNELNTVTFDVVNAETLNLAPSIEISENASISPEESIQQNFEEIITYTVTAENGDQKSYNVIVDNTIISSENRILTFSVEIDNQVVEATIDDEANTISFNSGDFDVTNIIPNITISENASITPEIGEAVNFETNPVFTVTAESGDISEYTVIRNVPRIDGVSTLIASLTNNPVLLYSRADIRVSGVFLNPEISNTRIFISDGSNSYDMDVLAFDSFPGGEFGLQTFYNVELKIPENVVTGSDYKLFFEQNEITTESNSFLDILSENVPTFSSLNQDSYSFEDTMIITGENLKASLVVPSNGSNFIIENNNAYNIIVNDEGTEIIFVLDTSGARGLFPSFFGSSSEEKIITLIGPNRRAGEAFRTIFN